MINLLPPDLKQDYRYARTNSRLLRWCLACLTVIIGVGLITGGGVLVMRQSSNNHRQHIANVEANLQSQNVAQTQKEVAAMSNNLDLMIDVLSKEVLFSQLLTRLGSITPANTVLTDPAISQADSAIDITASIGNYDAAAQLAANLADPSNDIFAKADIVSISCPTATPATNPDYPCTTVIRALFLEDNPFLFINKTSKT